MCDKKKVAKHVKHDARSFFFLFLWTPDLPPQQVYFILYFVFFFGFFYL